MIRILLSRLFFVAFLVQFGSDSQADSGVLGLRDGDRVVLVGGTFIERMQQYGCLETLLTVAHPGPRITFRNLGWSGDTVWGESRALFGSQADGYARLLKDVKAAKPTVLVICYGANEAHAGQASLLRFVDGLNHLLDDLSDTRARVVLLSPYAYQAGLPGVPAPDDYNAQLNLYCGAIENTAAKRNAGYVSLFDLLDAVQIPNSKSGSLSMTENGLHLTEAGYRRAAFEIATRLGIDPPQLDFSAADQRVEQLLAAIRLKNELYFHRYRPQNETYLFLFRKHEQGNNAVEIPQFDPLVEEQERVISELVQALVGANSTILLWIGGDRIMYEAIGRGLTLWLRNIPLLTALTLTVWLPCNIATNYLASQSDAESLSSFDFWMSMWIDSIFGPLSIGAVIYALDRRWQGREVGYFESMRAGLRCWGRLFITMLIADILVGLSTLLLVVPGIILALRYSLIGMAVTLEGRSGGSARLRSSDLMRGRMWGVLAISIVSYGFILSLVGALYIAFAFLDEVTTMMTELQYLIGETAIDCLFDVLSVPVLAIMFCIYVQASEREKEPEVIIEEIAENVAGAPFDDDNPYHPPSSL